MDQLIFFRTESYTVINLPTFSGAMMIALVLASLFMLGVFFAITGPALISGVDAYGRRLDESVAWWRKLMIALIALIFAIYLAMQASLLYQFFPYFLDQGVVAVEVVTNKAEVRTTAGSPIAFWITTETHRFGVSEDIYNNIAVGNTVQVRYRAVDDTLFSIDVLDNSLATPTPSGSPPSQP